MYELDSPSDLAAPVLVASFDGWVNAGSAGIEAAEHIRGDAEPIAVFDPDELFDYRVNRPVVEFTEGVLDEIELPSMRLYRRRLPERDVLVLTGTEPNWQWRAFAAAVADIEQTLGVVEHISIGGIPAAVPHTRATPIVSTATSAELIDESIRMPVGRLRVPGAAVTVVAKEVSTRGIPAVGLWAQVPHYIGVAYQPAVKALLERLSYRIGVTIPLGSLAEEAADQVRQLDAMVADRPETRSLVEKLELLVDNQEAIPSGEDIAAEIERFLSEAGDESAD